MFGGPEKHRYDQVLCQIPFKIVIDGGRGGCLVFKNLFKQCVIKVRQCLEQSLAGLVFAILDV